MKKEDTPANGESIWTLNYKENCKRVTALFLFLKFISVAVR